MRQHFNEALLWSVAALAVFAVGCMVVLIARGPADHQPAIQAAIPQASAVDTPAQSPAPKPTLPKKLSRAQIAAQKKAAAIAAKPTRFETKRVDDVAMAGGGIPALLIAAAIIVSPFWLFVIWRRWLRRRRAMIQGEAWEQGRIRAQQRAGLV